tara:strand:- start:49 stop:396 length:348 start_codon:yes stop_codon:yes gene_type:complete
MDYTIYTTATGTIIGTGFSNVASVSDIGKTSDQTVVEGTYSPGQYRFVEGTATAIDENPLDYVRSQRVFLLSESDWTQVADSPLSDSKKAEWATYRQALRDLPSTDPISFPTEPS